MSDSAKRKAAENHCDKVAPSISWSYTHRRVVEESFKAGWDAALASDAKLLEKLKALCDHIDKRYWKTPIMGAEPTIETSEIRALFGWNATTKDLHTQTTKGDT